MIGLRRCVPPRLAPGVRTEIRKSEEDEATKRTKNATHESHHKEEQLRVSTRFCTD